MSHHPWMKFYPSAWRSDPALRMCSIMARGVWIEMICIMHEAVPRGSLLINGKAPNDRQIAGNCGCSTKEVSAAIAELEEAGVLSRDEQGVIFSRRMKRDEEKLERDKANGATGGNPKLKGVENPKPNPRVNPRAEQGVNPPDKAHARAKTLDTRLQNKSPSDVAPNPTPATGRPTWPDDWLETLQAEARPIRGGEQAVALGVGPLLELQANGCQWQTALDGVRAAAAKITDGVQTISPILSFIKTAGRNLEKARSMNGFGRSSATPPANGATLDPATFNDDTWDSIVRISFIQRRQWKPEWGPAPKQPGCLVPRHILEQVAKDEAMGAGRFSI
jgi:hypothetical protein